MEGSEWHASNQPQAQPVWDGTRRGIARAKYDKFHGLLAGYESLSICANLCLSPVLYLAAVSLCVFIELQTATARFSYSFLLDISFGVQLKPSL